DGIRDFHVTGVQTCALPICLYGSSDPATDVQGGEVQLPVAVELQQFRDVRSRVAAAVQAALQGAGEMGDLQGIEGQRVRGRAEEIGRVSGRVRGASSAADET